MIVILGASCSGKSTLIETLSSPDTLARKYVTKFVGDNNFNYIKEYTTRPPRHPIRNVTDDNTYHYITQDEYFQMLHNGMFVSNFEVDVHGGIWYYGIRRDEAMSKNAIVVTNPTSFTQLQKHIDPSDIYSIYLDISQRERLIRMLRRGDNVSESYRRSVHDEGHFSGLNKRVSICIGEDSDTPEQMLDKVYAAINQYLKKV